MRLWTLPTNTGIDDLTLGEAETPRPGRGQVLIRMRACSLNYRDLMIATNSYGRGSIPANLVPLSDGAGEVVAIGPDVTRVAVGDRVAGIFTQAWIGGDMQKGDETTALAGAIDGMLAEYKLLDQAGVVKLPEHLSFEEGATLPCAAVTAWNALYGLRRVAAGETVLILGTGGVSIFGLQFAHAAGARVITTSASDEKLQRVRRLGADDTINYKATPDWEKEVLRLTSGRGVDHVVEVGGAATLPKSIASATRGGIVSLIGVLTKGEINPMPILGGGVIVRGLLVGSREMFEAMNRAITLHRIKPVVDKVFPFDQAKDAYRYLQSQAHLGKVVIRVD
jgi:NADPH:quinone reductase-like Zn-dependent oxidoreductase